MNHLKMNIKSNFRLNFLITSIGLILLGCVKDRDFKKPSLVCTDENLTNISISELKEVYADQTIQIQEDWVVEGYVASSDKEGNFFNVLYFQDKPSKPTQGLHIEFELRDSHLFFDIGQHIFIKLKGLYLGKSKGVFKIGGVFTSFGNTSVGRLPNSVVYDHILLSCDTNSGIEPTSVSITALNESMVGTLVKIDNVEFMQDEVGKPFALVAEETKRNLTDCDDNELILLNSGYSDFQDHPIPEESGAITGILSVEGDELQLIIRDLNDLEFDLERCEDLVDEFTSDAIVISELADPDNNAGARFVELYNSADETLSLKGWSLVRYTNANTTVSSSIDLSDYSIQGHGLLVVSPNATEFEVVYNRVPDIVVGTNSPADSNGDDNIVLLDPFGTVIDIFGVIGEDGSGTNHEFEDGRAVRKIDVVKGNSLFTPNEWQVFNDTGGAGTVNSPQNAPMDFSPGIR
ncbi:DUF5689 domain-containing protein [Maribacter sp. X9]|uniref:DUF5689 domain-containing protein n=1 Tax=Maribacter sp. X9 TaxID=3402159 RepID=UPI003AF3DEC7